MALGSAAHMPFWLKPWVADNSSKYSLCGLPFEPNRLFGSELDKFMEGISDKKVKSLPQQSIRGQGRQDRGGRSGQQPALEVTGEAYIQDYICKGALEEVPAGEWGLGIYSPVFLVPKPSGDLRMIIDLRYFNRFIRKVKFRIETIKSVVHVLNPGDMMATLDLKDAYLHIPIHPASRKYLRITVQVSGVIRHLLFVALPFGISSAPHTFTKVVVCVVSALRLQGLTIIPYLDDWL